MRALWTSGRLMFRLQLNWPARHDMRNSDAVILQGDRILGYSREHRQQVMFIKTT